MSAAVFLWGIAFTSVAWLVHLVVWRVARPVDDLKVLALCMLAFPAGLAGIAWLCGLTGPEPLMLALILSESLGIAYVFWYPAAQAASPTMLITILARQAGPAGISEEQLGEALSGDKLAGESIANLFHEKFAVNDADGTVRLAPRGRRTLAVIRFLRRTAELDEPRG